MTMKIWINGSPSSLVHATDRGLSYGDGVFTTLPVQSGAPLFLDRHLQRLQRDAGRIKLPSPQVTQLESEIRAFLKEVQDGIVKIVITRGQGGRGYLPPPDPDPTRILSLFPPKPEASHTDPGMIATYCTTVLGHSPSLAGVKHLNRLEQVLARSELQGLAVDEGIMRDPDGFVVEGTMSNLFGVQGNQVFTPLLDRCGVQGVMRGLVIDGLRTDWGVAVEERRVTAEDLLSFDEVFLTNGVIGIQSLTQLDTRVYPKGPMATKLRGWLEAQKKRNIEAWQGREN